MPSRIRSRLARRKADEKRAEFLLLTIKPGREREKASL
jgi:hypothetical protein